MLTIDIDLDHLESTIRTLMNESTLTWSIKRWCEEVEQLLHINLFNNNDLKQKIKEIILSEGQSSILN